MHKQPLLIMLLCFIIGIILADHTVVGYVQSAVATAFAFLLACLGFVKQLWLQKLRPLFLGIFFAAAGALLHSMNSVAPEVQTFEGRQAVLFTLSKKLNSSAKYRRYEVQILKVKNSASYPFNAVISVPKTEPQLDFAHEYQTTSYINNVEAPDNDFQFNYARYLSRKKIFHQIFVNDALQTREKTSLSFAEKIKQRRLEVLMRIDHSGLSPKTREFLKGIILADRTEMDSGTVADFSRSGLVHLLAISGSHMVIIFGLFLVALRSAFAGKYRNIAIITALAAVWIFAVFIDFGSSVVRSCIMITAFYIFVLLQRKPDLLHAMALAAFCILAADTHQLFDVGFQLSFMAVLGIYWLNQPILSYFGTLTSKPKRFLANVFSVSLSAQLATLPLVIYYFHQYSLLSILANLVVIPFSEIIIVLSLMMTLLLSVNIELDAINLLFDSVVEYLLKLIHWFAEQDVAFAEAIPMTFAEATLLIVAFFFLREILLRRNFEAVMKMSGVLLLFLAVRLALHVYEFKKEISSRTQLFKDEIIIIQNNGAVHFFISDNVEPAKVEQYIAKPYLARHRITDYKIFTIPAGTQKIAVEGHQIKVK